MTTLLRFSAVLASLVAGVAFAACSGTIQPLAAGGRDDGIGGSSSATTVTTDVSSASASATQSVSTSATSGSSTTTGATGGGGSGGAGGDDGGGGGWPATCAPPANPIGHGAFGGTYCACPCAFEAPALLNLIADAARVAADNNGKPCDWALPVPASVPEESCYQPQIDDGWDFYTGNATYGWKCLGVSAAMTQVIRCQYRYVTGSGYVGPALGGPDPGPEGFEVSAQGDYDADSVVSTFTVAGIKDPQTGKYILFPMFKDQPSE